MCCLKYDMVLLCALFHLILNGIGLKSSTLWMRRLRLTKVKGLPKAMSLRRAEKPVFWCLISLIPLNSVTGQRVVSYDVSTQAVDVHQHTHTYGSHSEIEDVDYKGTQRRLFLQLLCTLQRGAWSKHPFLPSPFPSDFSMTNNSGR